MKRLIAIVAVACLAVLGLASPANAAVDPAVAQGQATRLYSAYFLRDPDLAGLRFWIDRLEGGGSLQDVSQFFAESPEFEDRYGELTDAEFIELVYQNVLDRSPDATGRAFWLAQLRSGAIDRGGVMIGFSESPEYVEQTETTPPVPARSFNDGTHVEVAGTWRNLSNAEGCYWARTAEEPDGDELPNGVEPPAPGTDGIIANDLVENDGRSIVTVEETDAAFITDGCGTWVPDIGPITVSPTAPFGEGTFRVGRDVAPGTWRSSRTDDTCTLERLADFSGEDDAVIEAETESDRSVLSVTIDEGDAGFWSEGCGTWSKVG